MMSKLLILQMWFHTQNLQEMQIFVKKANCSAPWLWYAGLVAPQSGAVF